MSHAFAEATAALGVRRSVGRTGSCFDNALAESFNASLKVERVHRTVYPTREHARKDVTRYIEFRYNTKRLHSALGYRTPQEVHDEHLNRQIAASLGPITAIRKTRGRPGRLVLGHPGWRRAGRPAEAGGRGDRRRRRRP